MDWLARHGHEHNVGQSIDAGRHKMAWMGLAPWPRARWSSMLESFKMCSVGLALTTAALDPSPTFLTNPTLLYLTHLYSAINHPPRPLSSRLPTKEGKTNPPKKPQAMSPPLEDQLDTRLKDVIQLLYEIQLCISGFAGPQTRTVLINKINTLTSSLQTLSTTAAPLTVSLPPEVIDYVEDGRNPDIYTREFVESAQKLNMLLKGKSEAFCDFTDVLGEELVAGGFAGREEVEGVKSREVNWGVEKEEVKEEGEKG